jgi:CRISPR-associated endoribonuclease Cas6
MLRGGFGSALRKIACSPGCPGRERGNVSSCELRESCAYARIFEPAAVGAGPSGLADRPRPFVFRAAHLEGSSVAPGEPFWFDVNLFETREPILHYFERAFAEMGRQGFGPRRSAAELLDVQPVDCEARVSDGAPISIPLEPGLAGAHRLLVEFRTPTELKSAHGLAATPEFGVLFARARDRVSALRALYGAGPLDIDFRGMGARAAGVRMSRCEVEERELTRRSSRNGQIHSLGGFVGVAEYEGDVGEFLPYLEAARWTGVGRQCVWGKGEIHARII